MYAIKDYISDYIIDTNNIFIINRTLTHHDSRNNMNQHDLD